MTAQLEQAARKALEAAQAVLDHRYQMGAPTLDIHNDLATALTALRSALHQEAGDAVAWLVTGGRTFVDRAYATEADADRSLANRKDGAEKIPLYTSPPIEQGDGKDAERYRWLLDNCGSQSEGDHMNPPLARINFTHYSPGVIGAGPSIDAAVDAAIATRQGTK